MLRLLTVIVSVPNALPETVKLWFCSKMASHSARADQLAAKAHSMPSPTVAPKLLLLLVLVKEAGILLTVSPGLLVPTQAPPLAPPPLAPAAYIPFAPPYPYNWSGFYIGGNLGAGFTNTGTATDTFAAKGIRWTSWTLLPDCTMMWRTLDCGRHHGCRGLAAEPGPRKV
jgi:hypothetical protein